MKAPAFGLSLPRNIPLFALYSGSHYIFHMIVGISPHAHIVRECGKRSEYRANFVSVLLSIKLVS